MIRGGGYGGHNVTKSGAPGEPITYKAYPNETPVLADDFNCEGHSHITIDGLRRVGSFRGFYIEGSPGGETGIVIRKCSTFDTSGPGIMACGALFGQNNESSSESNLTDLLIEDCDIERTNQPSGVNECISVGNGLDGFIIRRNTIHDSRQYGIDAKYGAKNGQIYDNKIWNIVRHGIYIDTAERYCRNIDIFGNEVFGCLNGVVLTRENFQADPDCELRSIRVFNNLLYNMDKWGVLFYKHSHDTLLGVATDILVHSNTVWNTGTSGETSRGIDLDLSIATNVRCRNNIVWQCPGNIRNTIGATLTANLVGTNPMFLDAPAADFRVQANSPAKEAGTHLEAPELDFAKLARSAPHTIGAHR